MRVTRSRDFDALDLSSAPRGEQVLRPNVVENLLSEDRDVVGRLDTDTGPPALRLQHHHANVLADPNRFILLAIEDKHQIVSNAWYISSTTDTRRDAAV